MDYFDKCMGLGPSRSLERLVIERPGFISPCTIFKYNYHRLLKNVEIA